MQFTFRRLLRRSRIFIAATACGFCAVPTLYAAPISGPHIASVVELFTSQGCSSCPPADHLLTSLARAPDVVALSLPIDYWDFIGWRDTLASPAFTARQKAYAMARGDGHVYTPQAVVDGLVDAVGSDRAQIERAIAQTKGRDGAMTVAMHLVESHGDLHIDVGSGPQTTAGVYVLRVARAKTVVISRGENSGRSMTYTNVVRAIHKIGEWTGAEKSFDLTELKGDDEGYVVLLQREAAGGPSVILGAAKSAGL